MKVAITGNIGSGKSTLASMLKEALPEYLLVSIDDIVADLYGETIFCKTLKDRLGTSNKKDVSDIVFADPEKRKWLEEESTKRVREILHYRTFQHTNVLVEFPLLFEYSAQINYSHVITAYVDEAKQIERVKARNGFSEEKIKAIMGAQLSTEIKKLLADDAIDTDCPLNELREVAYLLAGKIRAKDLRNRFFNDFGDYHGLDPIWKALSQAYSEPHRYYHTLVHLGFMFSQYDKIRHKLKHPKVVALAIWFHDFVYQTAPSAYPENEVESVKAMFGLFQTHLGTNISAMKENNIPVLAAAGEFILATKGHAVKSLYLMGNADLKHDCEVFLDLDLAVLFSNAITLKEFESDVKLEFPVPPIDYAKGRVAALSTFLKRPTVLQSTIFADQEPQARCSLELIVAKWQKKIDDYPAEQAEQERLRDERWSHKYGN